MSGDGAARVEAAIRTANDAGRAALICYLPAGFPDLPTSVAALVAAAQAGADVLEVGFPFSDPTMDGPTIQAACQRALDAGYRVDDFLGAAAEVTAAAPVPALVMTYYTVPYVRGLERSAAEFGAAGLSGAILPDLPASEADEWVGAARGAGLATVFLAASVSSDARLEALARASSGFVYATGLLGVTGVRTVEDDATAALVDRIRRHADLPVCVGVGVSTADQAAAVARYADGVIVGSALVRAADGDPADAPQRVAALVGELRAGVERATVA